MIIDRFYNLQRLLQWIKSNIYKLKIALVSLVSLSTLYIYVQNRHKRKLRCQEMVMKALGLNVRTKISEEKGKNQ